MDQSFEFTAFGHPNIVCSHRTTWQITTEEDISPRADCIIGVKASIGINSLPKWLKNHLQKSGKINIELHAGNQTHLGSAQGHPDLLLSDEKDIVFRKSEFISPRTIAIKCSFAAIDLSTNMKRLLQNSDQQLIITIKPFQP